MSRYIVGVIGLICLLALDFYAPAPAWSAKPSGKQGDLLLMYFKASPHKFVFNLYHIKENGELKEIDGFSARFIYLDTVDKKGWAQNPRHALKLNNAFEGSASKKIIKQLQDRLRVKKASGKWGTASWLAFHAYYSIRDNKGTNPQTIDLKSHKILALNLDYYAKNPALKWLFGDSLQESAWDWRINQNAILQKLPDQTKREISLFAGLAKTQLPVASEVKLRALIQKNRELREELGRSNSIAKEMADKVETLGAKRDKLLQVNADLRQETERLQKENTRLKKLVQTAQNDPQKALMQLSRDMRVLSEKLDDLSRSVDVSVERRPDQGRGAVFPWHNLVLILVLLLVCMTGLLFVLLRSRGRQERDQFDYDLRIIKEQIDALNQPIYRTQQSIRQVTAAQSVDHGQMKELYENLRQYMAQIEERISQLNRNVVDTDYNKYQPLNLQFDALLKLIKVLVGQLSEFKNQLPYLMTVDTLQGKDDSGPTNQLRSEADRTPSTNKMSRNTIHHTNRGGVSDNILPNSRGQEAGDDTAGYTRISMDHSPIGGHKPPGPHDSIQVTSSVARPTMKGWLGPDYHGRTEHASRDEVLTPAGGQVPSDIAPDDNQREAVLTLEDGLRIEVDQMARDIVQDRFNTRTLASYDKVASAMELLRNFFRPGDRQGEERDALNASLAGPLLEAWRALRRDKVFTHPEIEMLLAGTEQSRSALTKALSGAKRGTYEVRIKEILHHWREKVLTGRQQGEVVQGRQSDQMEKALVDFISDYVLPFLDKWSDIDLESQKKFKDMKLLGISAKGLEKILDEIRQRCGLESIEPKPFQPYDKVEHLQVATRNDAGSNNAVAEVIKPGFRMWLGSNGIKDKSVILRQAKVVVTVRDRDS